MATIISTITSTGITLSPSDNPVLVTGTITPTSGIALYGPGDGTNTWTIDNAGLISASDTASGYGIRLGSSSAAVGTGFVTNQTGGTIEGGHFGLYVNGNGSVTNASGGAINSQKFGVDIHGVGIVSNASNGTISGTTIAAYVYGAGPAGDQSGVQIYNAGTLIGSDGAVEFAGGSVTNIAGGTIDGLGKYGILLGGPGTVVNAGKVIGGTYGATTYPSAVYAAINLGEGGSVVNQAGGTISGYNGVYIGGGIGGVGGTLTTAGTVMATGSNASAVTFGKYLNNYRLIVDPGAVFVGAVNGGGGVLEFATGSGAGSLSGIGTSITNFATLQFDGGSPWSVSGNAAGLTAMSAITGLTAGDTIDLTGFAATSESFAGGVLALTNSAAATAMLNFPDQPGIYAFAFAPDGAGGTDIAGAGSGQTLTWNGGNGEWNVASNWLPQSVPTGFDTATIASPGSVTIAAAANNAVANLTIGDTGDTLEIDGSLVVTGTASIDAGTLTVGGAGTLSAAAITDNALLAFTGVHALDTPLGLAGTLQNTGTLIFGTGETITQTSPSATIDSTGLGSEIYNLGTIDANSGGGSLAIVPLSFINTGTIDATGETLTIGDDNNGVRSSWNNNSGTISNATSLVLNGSVTTDNMGTIINSGAITEAGLIDNTGATLAVGSSGTLGTINLISGGTVSGGAIVDANGDGFAFNGGTLDGVIYQGPLELINPGDGVTIANGLTVTGTGGSSPGTIDLTGTAAALDLAAMQTLDNVTLNIGNASTATADGDVLSADHGGTVTLGKNASIDSLGVFATLLAEAGTTLDLGGTLTALSGDTVILAASGGTFSNDGSIAVSGGTLDVNTALDGVSSGGTIGVSSGGVVDVTAAVAADQTLAFADASGLLQLNDPGSFAGTITGFDSGSTIDLTNFTGTVTSFANNVLTLSSGIKLNIEGPFNPNEFVLSSDGNNGTDITWISAPGTFNWIGNTGDWNMPAAWDLGSVPMALDSATIAQAGTNTITIDQADTIANLTLNGASDTVSIGATGFLQAGSIAINAGTLSDTGGFAASQVTDDGVLGIVTNGTQTLDNTPLSLGGTLVVSSAFAGTLTLGPGEIVTQDGANALIASSGNDRNAVINQGTIDANFGGQMTIAPLIFVNQGTIDATGETLTIGYDNGGTLGSWSNNGGTISNAASLVMDGSLTTGNIGIITGSGGITEVGLLDNSGATLNVGSGTQLGTITLTTGGVVSGGTIVDQGGGFVFSGGTLSNVTYQGPLELTKQGAQAIISNGVTVMGIGGSLPGTIDLTGAGASLNFATAETLDNATVNIGNATSADLLQASFNGGSLVIGPNASIVSGDLGALATLTAGSGTMLDLDGTLDAIASGGTFTLGDTGGTFINDGSIVVGNGDTLDAATAITAGAGNGTIDVGGGGVADFAGAVAAGEALDFTDATGILRLHQPTSFAATIDNFASGNTIDLANFTADTAVWSPGTLTISNAGGSVAALTLLGDYTDNLFNVTTDGADSLVTVTATCYAAGTRILTPGGEIAIERLRAGDLVQTVSGRTQPIDWIGHRRVDFQRHPNRGRVLPVRIAAHAFGPNQPRRELLLSPDHAVFVEDVLIPIRHLINGTTVAQIERRAITYYHIELPRHDVLLANGMPAESYLEAGARDAFANGGGFIQLHPDFAPPLDHYAMLWEAQGYAPLVVTGAALERARETLAREAPRYARSHRSRGASSKTSAPAA
jgi:Hint domain